MEIVLETFYSFGLSLLGGVLYTLYMVWDKVKADRKWDYKKFFGENKLFWSINVMLALVLSLLLNIEPDTKSLVQSVGIAVETTRVGFVWIGVFLAGGTNKAPMIKSVQNAVNKNGAE